MIFLLKEVFMKSTFIAFSLVLSLLSTPSISSDDIAETSPLSIKPQSMSAMEWLNQLEDARSLAKSNKQTEAVESLTKEIGATLSGKYGFRSTPATKEEIAIILKSVTRTRTYYPNKLDIINDLYFSHASETCISNIALNSHFAEHMGIIVAIDAIRSIIVDSSIDQNSGITIKSRHIAQSILKDLFDPEQYSTPLDLRFQPIIKQIAIDIHRPENKLIIEQLFESISEVTFENLLKLSIDGEAIYCYTKNLIEGEDKDLLQAIEFLRRSVKLGYQPAQKRLAIALNNQGNIILKNNPEGAVELFEEAFSYESNSVMNKNLANALYKLAKALRKNNPNDPKVTDLLQRSSDLGYEPAKKALSDRLFASYQEAYGKKPHQTASEDQIQTMFEKLRKIAGLDHEGAKNELASLIIKYCVKIIKSDHTSDENTSAIFDNMIELLRESILLNPNLDIFDPNNSITNAKITLATILYARARQLIRGTSFGTGDDNDIDKAMTMLAEANILAQEGKMLLPNYTKILELLAKAKTMKQIEGRVKFLNVDGLDSFLANTQTAAAP